MAGSSRRLGEKVGESVFGSDAIDELIAPYMEAVVGALDGEAPLLAEMVRYHLGMEGGAAGGGQAARGERGKRVRPAVAILSAAAAGGDGAAAAPLAAAVELLHNFTLIHDDIQDESPTRRHRRTVWHRWGIGQAINAGDALFAAAHLPLVGAGNLACPPELILRLVEAFDQMTIAIVTGQTLDLGFEGRGDVTPDDYLTMIDRKTAAIVRFAAWAGALLGGADEATAARFAAFGRALGLGFQVRDDLLGVWGAADETGKAAADDIRRRKQSLPILLLRERASGADRAALDALSAAPEIGGEGVARVLALLDEAGVRPLIEERIAGLHDQARRELLAAARPGPNPGRDRLLELVERLAERAG